MEKLNEKPLYGSLQGDLMGSIGRIAGHAYCSGCFAAEKRMLKEKLGEAGLENIEDWKGKDVISEDKTCAFYFMATVKVDEKWSRVKRMATELTGASIGNVRIWKSNEDKTQIVVQVTYSFI